MPAKQNNPPTRKAPDSSWKHSQLYHGVRDAISSLPSHFKTETYIAGIMATDLFTLGAALGATIEEQVVSTLNDMREIWDPADRYELYHFSRQSQTFPDVLLKHHAKPDDIILGLELKGWYLIAKEGEPSFRYQVTPAVCNLQDLIVVVPWALSNVISGTPKVFAPYLESALFAAEYRNYHWSQIRKTTSSAKIISPKKVSPYPRKSDAIADKPVSDAGGNFGRFARTGIMDHYLEEMGRQPLCGIEAHYWRAFFKAFQDQKTPEAVQAEIDNLITHLSADDSSPDEAMVERFKHL